MKNLDPKWRDFLKHLGSYIIVIGMLTVINLMTSADSLWVVWPAMGWGIGLAFHLMGVLMGEDDKEADGARRRASRKRRERMEVKTRPSRVGQSSRGTTAPVETPAEKGKLVSENMQAYLERARAYQNQIESMAKASPEGIVQSRRQDLAAEVAEWVWAIEKLARRVDSFQHDALIKQDLQTVPQAIKDLETRLADETDADVREQLERTLANRQSQLVSLEQLQSMMKRAEIQIESTVSSLGTIYSQLLTGQSTDHVADHSRLLAGVDEEVHRLRDQLEALEEVKLGRGSGL